MHKMFLDQYYNIDDGILYSHLKGTIGNIL